MWLNRIRDLVRLPADLKRLELNFEQQKLLAGRLLSGFNRDRRIDNIHEVEFKVFSQYGDDGIIDYLVTNIPSRRIFIEFGVENYTESNTRFLMMNRNWSGLVMDGNRQNIEYIKKDVIYRRFNLKAEFLFVTTENINDVLTSLGFIGEIGLLSIDIDGNDYWVWKAIKDIDPVIVVVEFNSIWGSDRAYTVPYDAKFDRTVYHFSNLVYGSSLLSLCDLAEEKGYLFVGCNSAGNNAYFVKKDRLNGLLPGLTPSGGYVLSQFSESRDGKSHWTFLKHPERLKAVEGVTVFNTRTGKTETFSSI